MNESARKKALCRVLLWHAQHGRCSLCEGAIDFPKPQDPEAPTSDLSLDHLNPRAAGGIDDIWNLGLAHIACNGDRGERALTGAQVYAAAEAQRELCALLLSIGVAIDRDARAGEYLAPTQ